MRQVVLKYSGIYLLLHLYFLWTLHVAFPAHRVLLSCGALAGFVLLAAPFLGRALDHAGHYRTARVLSLTGSPWAVMLMWFCTLALLRDFWNVSIRLTSAAMPALAGLSLPPRPMLALSTTLVIAALAWSLYEARNVRLEQVVFRTSRIRKPVRILQISDLHLGVSMSRGMLRRVLDLIEKARPDIIVSTGDLVDGCFHNMRDVAERIASIQPRMGKYAVLGNHEYYSGLTGSLTFLKKAGFAVIRGESIKLGEVRLAGVDDPAGARLGEECHSDDAKALPNRADDEVVVLLKHRPTVNSEARGRFDLQLSGHTHGGQVSSDRVVLLAYSLPLGLGRIDNHSASYVSRGTGTWGPPMRLFSPPEVTLITLEPATA